MSAAVSLPTLKERPILFSGAMVRALLAGTKTQTRRIVNPLMYLIVDGDEDTGRVVEQSDPTFGERATELVSCPYGATGDRLWVRETVRWNEDYKAAFFAADNAPTVIDTWVWQRPLLPSIHMPRGVCRLLLEVASSRVERLQAISEDDAKAEGVERTRFYEPEDDLGEEVNGHGYAPPLSSHVGAYEALWDEINGKKAAWAKNPWVWVVSFRRLR